MTYPQRQLLCALILLTAAMGARGQNAGNPAGSPPEQTTVAPAPEPTAGSPAPEPMAGTPAPSGPEALSFLAGTLRAPQYVDLLAGLGYTTNAYLTKHNPEPDGIALAGFGIDYIRQGPELDLDALGDLERVEYVKGSLPGSFYGEFNGSAIWGHPTELFQWLLSDTFGEGMLNPLLSPTPVNLQTINYATTGPYLNFNFDAANRLTMFGLYSRTTFERSPFDSESYRGGASVSHALSSVSSFSLQASDQYTEFLEKAVVQSAPGAAHGYDTRAAWGSYTGEFGRTHFSASGGYNTVDYGGPQRGAPLASLEFTRQLSPLSTVFLEGQTGYSSLGNSLASPTSALASVGSQSLVESGTGAVTGTAAAAPFDRTTGGLGWTIHGNRTSLALIATVAKQSYVQESTFSQTNTTANVSLRHELGPTLSAQLQLVQTYAHYPHIDSDGRTSAAHLSVSRQFRKAVLSAYVQWLQARSTAQTATVPVASYTDERVGLEFSYDLIGHRIPGQFSLPGQL